VPCETGIKRARLHGTPTKFENHLVQVVQTIVTERENTCTRLEYLEDLPEPNCGRDSEYHASTCSEKWAKYTSMVLAEPSQLRHEFDFYAHTTMSGYPDLSDCESNSHNFCVVDPGADVMLIYWPPEVTSRDICANGGAGTASTVTPSQIGPKRIAVLPAITLKGPDIVNNLRGLGPDDLDSFSWPEPEILTGPFTFISPTVYLAHRDIYISTIDRDNFWAPGRVPFVEHTKRAAGIVPLQPSDVFSLRRHHSIPVPPDYPSLVAKGKFNYTFRWDTEDGWENFNHGGGPYDILPFDYGNLIEPVPASIYYDARADYCWGGNQSHCATITEGSYRPQLAFKRDFWENLVPNYWASGCVRPHVVDPPVALWPVDTISIPTLVPAVKGHAGESDQAKPGSSAERPWPQATPTGASSAVRSGPPSLGSESDSFSSDSVSRGNGVGEHDRGSIERNRNGKSSRVEEPGSNTQRKTPSSTSPFRYEIAVVGTDTISALFYSSSLIAAYIGTATIPNAGSVTVAGKTLSAGRDRIYIGGSEVSFSPLDGNGFSRKEQINGVSSTNFEGCSENQHIDSTSSQRTSRPGQDNERETDPTCRSELGSGKVSEESPSELPGIPKSTGRSKQSKGSVTESSLMVSNLLLSLLIIVTFVL
jgi:hypothetical protein